MIEKIITKYTLSAVKALYNAELSEETVQIQKTRKDFDGDITVVVFPFTRYSKKSPVETATEIGENLKNIVEEITDYNVVKGFLNLSIKNSYWLDYFYKHAQNNRFGYHDIEDGKPVVVEYSSPNTNKPLHLGHIRNNLLGYSVAEIVKASGKNVVKVNLVNDRGVHICKSMLAWQKWGDGETPDSTGIKGDLLVGKYYVIFDKKYKEEINALVQGGMLEDEAKKKAPLIIEAQEMLKKWEDGDVDVVSLWKKMNDWVYKGFDVTYKSLGVDFDKFYYESDTYLLGKQTVLDGLKEGAFEKRENGAVWADLTNEGLDSKLLIRSDGTTVYMTQDLGTAQLRFEEYNPEKMVYVVGNEQDYHFDVLKRILKNKLNNSWAESIFHLSYGMVELPHGKMKSREGTVVDADDLMREMTETARKTTKELGKIEDFSDAEAEELYKNIGLGALKYFILKVDPTKKILFNPEESVDFNGNTGPFIQYTYARICSVVRKGKEKFSVNDVPQIAEEQLMDKEKELLKMIYDFPSAIKQAAESYSPAVVANYVYSLVKQYNHYYHEVPIMKENDENLARFRIVLSQFTGTVIDNAMKLLGITVPERM